MLDELRSPLDLRALTEDELSALADEIREVLIRVVSQPGRASCEQFGRGGIDHRAALRF